MPRREQHHQHQAIPHLCTTPNSQTIPCPSMHCAAGSADGCELGLDNAKGLLGPVYNELPLTWFQIVPHIDGINSAKRISELADADYRLTKRCIEHLLYYGCLIMVDIFQFAAIYATTAEISMLLQDPSLQEECQAYISSSGPDVPKIPFAHIFALYNSLSQGVTLRKWCMEHARELKGIDIRRFISFGIVKGFLYRSHTYAVPTDGRVNKGIPLGRYIDGSRCLDEVCSELQISEKEVVKMIEGWDLQIVHR